MQALLISTGLIALAEIGDKTQLLALVLAARFRRPWPIIAGIALATLANHALAGLLGALLGEVLNPAWLWPLLAVGFVGMGLWTLVPDRFEGAPVSPRNVGVFLTTALAFFLVEIGDKTQVATVMLAARYEALAVVVLGTTAGMLLANVPVVLCGDAIAQRVPLVHVRRIAAAVFVLLGVGIWWTHT